MGILNFLSFKRKNENTLTCKNDLYKSTYRGNAFDKGKSYEVIDEDERFFWIKDNNGKEMNFSIERESPYLFLDDYFFI